MTTAAGRLAFSSPRSLVILGIAGMLAVLALSLVLPAGTLMIDEVVYALMVHEWADHGRRVILNGDFGFATDASGILLTRPGPGVSLLPQYPPLIADLVAPFYRLLGARGLFVANALGFVVGCAALGWIAWRLSGSRRVVVLTVAIHAFCGFSLQYAFAPWPHQLTTGLVLIGAAAMVEAVHRRGLLGPLALGAVAGAMIGLSIGVRLDGVLALAGLALMALFIRPMRGWPVLGLILGAVGPLIWISLINGERFGVWHPFTYGLEGSGYRTELTAYGGLAVLAVVAVVVLWGLSRLHRPRLWLALAGLAAAGAAVAGLIEVPIISGLVRNALLVLVDMPPIPPEALLTDRTLPFRASEVTLATGGRIASPSGQTLYHFTFKKALLQSLPWLPLIALGLLGPAAPAEARTGVLRALMLVVLGYVGFVAATGWHGGPAYNMRYTQPALGLLALAMAIGLERLRLRGAGVALPRVGLVFALGAVALVMQQAAPLPMAEILLLWVPLVLAVLAAAACLCAVLRPGRAAAKAAMAAALISLAWAFAVAVVNDLGGEQQLRAATRAKSDQLAAALPTGGTVLFGFGTEDHFLRTIAPAMIERDLSVVRPTENNFADLDRIVAVLAQRRTPTVIVAPLSPIVVDAQPTTQRQAMIDAVEAAGGKVSAGPTPPSGGFHLLRVGWE